MLKNLITRITEIDVQCLKIREHLQKFAGLDSLPSGVDIFQEFDILENKLTEMKKTLKDMIKASPSEKPLHKLKDFLKEDEAQDLE